jgi:hypothetical protein
MFGSRVEVPDRHVSNCRNINTIFYVHTGTLAGCYNNF